MRLTTLKTDDTETAAIGVTGGYLPLPELNRALDCRWPADMFELIESGSLQELTRWYRKGGRRQTEQVSEGVIPDDRARSTALYRRPRKIWGIGLNYAAHAADLAESAPSGIPGSFMKPDTTIIGLGEVIRIPSISEKTTAEAELGVIIGRTCRNVREDEWLSAVAGFTTIIDMTAEDILRQNPRYLTVSKSFDTFFSFGPQLLTPDEIEDVSELTVTTVINGQDHASNTVANMTFSPAALVSFLSQVMTLLPGDIISTGTPGSVPIRPTDIVECHISGFEPLINPVAGATTNR